MPYRKKSTYTRRKSRFYGRRRGSRKGGNLAIKTIRRYTPMRHPGPFPPELYCRLIYSDPGDSLTSTAGSFAYYDYKLNSLYDPDLTGAGGQPRWYDTLCGPAGAAAPYVYYNVLAAKVTVTFINSADYSGYVGFAAATTSGSLPTSFFEASENRMVKSAHITNNAGSKSTKTIKCYIPMYKVFGTQKNDMHANPNYSAVYNANPASLCYGRVFFQPDSANNASVVCDIKIDFFCRFYGTVQAQAS